MVGSEGGLSQEGIGEEGRTMTLMEWGPRPEPEPPPWTDAHPDPPYCFDVRPGVRTLGGRFCHALVEVMYVFLHSFGQANGVTWVIVVCFLSWGFVG